MANLRLKSSIFTKKINLSSNGITRKNNLIGKSNPED
jgi:hypothetical protein